MSNGSNARCGGWRNCRCWIRRWKCGCRSRSATRAGIRRPGATAWRPRSRARWNWPIRSATSPPGCRRCGACGRSSRPRLPVSAQALEVAEDYEAAAKTTGDRAAVVLCDPILGLTHHYLGNQETARQVLESGCIEVTRETGVALDTDFQLGSAVAVPVLLSRIRWLQGFPDQAMATLREAIDAAGRADHWFSLYYTLCLAGCPLALWVGDAALAQKYLDLTANDAADHKWQLCWGLVLRLRRGGARERLIASYLEPRLDFPTADARSRCSPRLPEIPVPQPDEDVDDTLWSLPEVLRVNADLLLWHGGPDAATHAEATLLRSLDLARRQSALGWELRSATSLARLWHGGGRVAEARDLLAATSDRFTEGFATGDVAEARRLSRWNGHDFSLFQVISATHTLSRPLPRRRPVDLKRSPATTGETDANTAIRAGGCRAVPADRRTAAARRFPTRLPAAHHTRSAGARPAPAWTSGSARGGPAAGWRRGNSAAPGLSSRRISTAILRLPTWRGNAACPPVISAAPSARPSACRRIAG